MYKTQFFRETNIEKLQENVNAWLGRQKDLLIVNSDHTSMTTDHGELYTCYIIYDQLNPPVNEAREIVSNHEIDVNSLKNIDLNPQ